MQSFARLLAQVSAWVGCRTPSHRPHRHCRPGPDVQQENLREDLIFRLFVKVRDVGFFLKKKRSANTGAEKWLFVAGRRSVVIRRGIRILKTRGMYRDCVGSKLIAKDAAGERRSS